MILSQWIYLLIEAKQMTNPKNDLIISKCMPHWLMILFNSDKHRKSLHRCRIFRGVQTLSMIHLPWNWGRKISVTQAPKDTWIHITAGQ